MHRTIDIVFDGPPDHEAGRFVEVERDGESISFGEWVKREDGFWALRIPDPEPVDKLAAIRAEIALVSGVVQALATSAIADCGFRDDEGLMPARVEAEKPGAKVAE
jgi:hypothetical protein